MTFDDGIVKIYRIENASDNGDMPKEEAVYKSSFYFGYDDVGIQRYYSAMANNQLIDSVINIQHDRSIKALDIVQFEDDNFFRIAMVQHPLDDDGIRYTKLTLERLNDEYNIKT
jgi:hypothetical protein